jgi:serine/threonine protein phosphatase 1
MVRGSVPINVRAYAVGDVHGCVSLLEQALLFIEKDLAENPVPRAVRVFVGDYIDRGPDSAKVVDLLIKYSEVNECIFLKGNHETYLMQFLKRPDNLSDWQSVGGMTTLSSYGVNFSLLHDSRATQFAFRREIPKDHLRFYHQLRPCFELGDFFFVHAGIRPGIDMSRQQEEDMLSIREEFLESDMTFEKIIVHGHTPVLTPDVRANRINIDTGAYATGKLTCLIIESDQQRLKIIS